MPENVHNYLNLPKYKKAIEEEVNEKVKRRVIFLHKAKLKVDISLQVDSWLYNEIMTLKKNVRELQDNHENEKNKKNGAGRKSWEYPW